MTDKPQVNSTLGVVHTTESLLIAFTAWQLQRGFSRMTIKRRRTSVTGLQAWMDPAPMWTARPDDIDDWLGTFPSARTRHAYRSDLAVFFKWGTRRGVLTENPMELVDSIKVPKSLPRPVPASRIDELIAAAPTRRIATAIALAAYAGLRRAEITKLTTDDIYLETVPPVLHVRGGKGGKDRAVPIHPNLARQLAQYRHGRVVPVTPNCCGTEVAAHLRACGINATMHQLRHTFGTEVVRASNGNLMLGGVLMGHESPNTTRGYVALVAGGDAAAAVGRMYGGAA